MRYGYQHPAQCIAAIGAAVTAVAERIISLRMVGAFAALAAAVAVSVSAAPGRRAPNPRYAHPPELADREEPPAAKPPPERVRLRIY